MGCDLEKNKKILTMVRFTKMVFEGPSRCYLCKENSETT